MGRYIMRVTQKEMFAAKYWGYKIIADFARNTNGVKFRKGFFNEEEFEDFKRSAQASNCTLIGKREVQGCRK